MTGNDYLDFLRHMDEFDLDFNSELKLIISGKHYDEGEAYDAAKSLADTLRLVAKVIEEGIPDYRPEEETTRLEELKYAAEDAAFSADGAQENACDAYSDEADAYEAYKFACANREELSDLYAVLRKKADVAKAAYEAELDKTVD